MSSEKYRGVILLLDASSIHEAPPGSEPVQNIPGSSNLGESSIWYRQFLSSCALRCPDIRLRRYFRCRTKDSTTGEVTALWINAGGASNEDQFIVYDPEEGLDSEIFLMSSTGAAFWSKQTVVRSRFNRTWTSSRAYSFFSFFFRSDCFLRP